MTDTSYKAPIVAEDLYRTQKIEAIEQLAGGIAHELNNSFQNIVASMELVRKLNAAGRANETERFIAKAMSSAQRVAGVTQRWLDFSRSASPVPRRVAINDLVDGIGELLRCALPVSIKVDLDLSPDLWDTWCNKNHTEASLLSLAVKARDAMPDGGGIVIQTRNAEVDANEASAAGIGPGEYVRISVSGSGGGMDQLRSGPGAGASAAIFLSRYTES
jgi:signal transduction histidine kinase